VKLVEIEVPEEVVADEIVASVRASSALATENNDLNKLDRRNLPKSRLK
jgi:hypothetical protein